MNGCTDSYYPCWDLAMLTNSQSLTGPIGLFPGGRYLQPPDHLPVKELWFYYRGILYALFGWRQPERAARQVKRAYITEMGIRGSDLCAPEVLERDAFATTGACARYKPSDERIFP